MMATVPPDDQRRHAPDAPHADAARTGAAPAGRATAGTAAVVGAGAGAGTGAGAAAAAPATRATIGYLDTVRVLDAAQAYKRMALDRLDLQPGHVVLDVGCGPGDDVRAAAARVGPRGRVVGIDSDYQMIAEAWRRLGSRPATPQVEFRVADAHRLPFDAATFDRCRSDRVLQHVIEPDVAIAEIVRVARPGARIVVSEPDWETLVLDTPDRAVTRTIVHFIADRVVRHGWIGRQLPRLFRAAGLQDVRLDPVAMAVTSFDAANALWALARSGALCREAGGIAGDTLDAWLRDLEEAGRSARFLGAQLGFVVSGCKP